ncbi:MAG: ATP-binding protein [Bryobacteraceae bacterium]
MVTNAARELRSPFQTGHVAGSVEWRFRIPVCSTFDRSRLPVEPFGRDVEKQMVSAAWDVTGKPEQQLVFISGEPGIGKTCLVLEFARSLSCRATVLVGRCDKEALLPFAPFVEILRCLLQACRPAALEAWLPDINGTTELAELVPEIARYLKPPSVSFPYTAEGRRYRMFEAYTELLYAASRNSPILMVLEDLHWAHRASMLLLRHLVRARREAAICIVVTYCETELQRNPENTPPASPAPGSPTCARETAFAPQALRKLSSILAISARKDVTKGHTFGPPSRTPRCHAGEDYNRRHGRR